MTERPKPYVGVSGVVDTSQHEALREFAPALDAVGRQLALGVKAMRKTLWQEIENRYGRAWYPVGNGIGRALIDDRADSELRVAQVFLDETAAIQADELNYEKRFVDKLLAIGGTTLNAIQFDMLSWDTLVHIDLFSHIRESRPDMKILLQAHKGQMVAHGATELAKRLYWYDGLVDYVLFDASHGTGVRMDTAALRPFVEEAYHYTSYGVGVAGGLNATVVHQDLPTLLRDYPDLSFDAEGQLHKNNDPDDMNLNMTTVNDYVSAAIDEIARARST